MNLMEDKWLPVIRADGQKGRIAPWEIAETENPVMNIDAPRPDFQGAMYQFLIGLLQTVLAPEDHDDWLELWEAPPNADRLRKSLEKVSPAFVLDAAKGPAFLQDLELELEKKGMTPVSGLLIESPGGKTQKDNLDHFVKRDMVSAICPSCCAMALFTLQANAPAGGVGHRVGLRGGGPLTTLVLPETQAPLWHRLWLNVMDQEEFTAPVSAADETVFPWLAPTRVSDKKGSDTTPENAHPLQMYWGMPRRIRIHFEDNTAENPCDLCGETDSRMIRRYATRNYGINYSGDWVHPLTPYRFDAKKSAPPLSLKGQQGGLGYRHWLGLVMNDPQNGDQAAKITRIFMEDRAFDIGDQSFARLWCSGYDMDNMKARCWYDHTFPLFRLKPKQQKNVLAWTAEFLNGARDTASILRSQLKAAWFKRPADAKGDMNSVIHEFWNRSEPDFYRLLKNLSVLPEDQRQAPPEIYAEWWKTVMRLAFKLFDAWALESLAEDLDMDRMERAVSARNGLGKKMNSLKSMKALAERAKPEKEAA